MYSRAGKASMETSMKTLLAGRKLEDLKVSELKYLLQLLGKSVCYQKEPSKLWVLSHVIKVPVFHCSLLVILKKHVMIK